jgi:hypothetical protein
MNPCCEKTKQCDDINYCFWDYAKITKITFIFVVWADSSESYLISGKIFVAMKIVFEILYNWLLGVVLIKANNHWEQRLIWLMYKLTVFTTSLWVRNYDYSPISDEETEAQQGEGTFLKSLDCRVAIPQLCLGSESHCWSLMNGSDTNTVVPKMDHSLFFVAKLPIWERSTPDLPACFSSGPVGGKSERWLPCFHIWEKLEGPLTLVSWDPVECGKHWKSVPNCIGWSLSPPIYWNLVALKINELVIFNLLAGQFVT